MSVVSSISAADAVAHSEHGQAVVVDARLPAVLVAAGLYALRVPFIVVVAVAAAVAAGIRMLW